MTDTVATPELHTCSASDDDVDAVNLDDLCENGHIWNEEGSGECDKCQATCDHEEHHDSLVSKTDCSRCGQPCSEWCDHPDFESDGECVNCTYQCPHKSVNAENHCTLCAVLVSRPLFPKELPIHEFVAPIVELPPPAEVDVDVDVKEEEKVIDMRLRQDDVLAMTKDEWTAEFGTLVPKELRAFNKGGTIYHTSPRGSFKCSRTSLRNRDIGVAGEFYVREWEHTMMQTDAFRFNFEKWMADHVNGAKFEETTFARVAIRSESLRMRWILFCAKYFYKQVFRWTLIMEDAFPAHYFALDEEARNARKTLVRQGKIQEEVVVVADVEPEEPKKRKRLSASAPIAAVVANTTTELVSFYVNKRKITVLMEGEDDGTALTWYGGPSRTSAGIWNLDVTFSQV